jgi:hypothetical protein
MPDSAVLENSHMGSHAWANAVNIALYNTTQQPGGYLAATD